MQNSQVTLKFGLNFRFKFGASAVVLAVHVSRMSACGPVHTRPYSGPSGVWFQTTVKSDVSLPREQQRNVNLNIVDGPYCLKHGN